MGTVHIDTVEPLSYNNLYLSYIKNGGNLGVAV